MRAFHRFDAIGPAAQVLDERREAIRAMGFLMVEPCGGEQRRNDALSIVNASGYQRDLGGKDNISTIAPAKDDAVILAAWGRYQAARESYDSDAPLGSDDALEKEMNDAEAVIQSTIAATPKGAEIQAWIALAHVASGRDADEAAYRGDLAWFNERDHERDWVERLLLAAIRSLRAIGGEA